MGFRVWGLGFGVWGFLSASGWFWFEGLGVWVWGVGFEGISGCLGLGLRV